MPSAEMHGNLFHLLSYYHPNLPPSTSPPANSIAMSLAEVYSNTEVCKLEEKFTVVKKSDSVWEGKYPLEPFRPDARGVYGGEFAAQSVAAAFESVEDKEFTPHSFHSYFLKAGLNESVMRYEVTNTSQGRNYCNRLVKVFQSHSNQLCYILMISFTRNNLILARKTAFANLSEEQKYNPKTKIPLEFSKAPHPWFTKYKDNVDELPAFEHTNGNLVSALPYELLKFDREGEEFKKDIPSRRYGGFVKVNNNLKLAKDVARQKIIDLAFVSDSFFLTTIVRAMGIPLLEKNVLDFFRVSLDHNVYIHDVDFDPTDWMFMDYNFERMSNDRPLCIVELYSRDGRQIASIQQEALAYVPIKLANRSVGGSYKL